jgi:hypothetical protein
VTASTEGRTFWYSLRVVTWYNHKYYDIISRFNLYPLNNRRTVAEVIFLHNIVNRSAFLNLAKLYVTRRTVIHPNLFY